MNSGHHRHINVVVEGAKNLNCGLLVFLGPDLTSAATNQSLAQTASYSLCFNEVMQRDLFIALINITEFVIVPKFCGWMLSLFLPLQDGFLEQYKVCDEIFLLCVCV